MLLENVDQSSYAKHCQYVYQSFAEESWLLLCQNIVASNLTNRTVVPPVHTISTQTITPVVLLLAYFAASAMWSSCCELKLP